MILQYLVTDTNGCTAYDQVTVDDKADNTLSSGISASRAKEWCAGMWRAV